MSDFEEDVLDLINCVEAGITAFKMNVAKRHRVSEEAKEKPTKTTLEYDPEKILWTQAEGSKGIYQVYPAFKQKPSMSVDYINLLADLNLESHKGRLQRAGLFYWLFDDNVTIGRKPAKK